MRQQQAGRQRCLARKAQPARLEQIEIMQHAYDEPCRTRFQSLIHGPQRIAGTIRLDQYKP